MCLHEKSRAGSSCHQGGKEEETSSKALQRGAMHSPGCPHITRGARLLPSPPVTRAKGRAGPQGPALHAALTPGVIYSPLGSDTDMNGREIQTRCPRALSKQVHINVQHSSQPELRCVKPLWLPEDQCDSIKPATEQGKRFLLTN